MVEEKAFRIFRVKAKIIIVDYDTMTFDYTEKDPLFADSRIGERYYIRKRYCKFSEEHKEKLTNALKNDWKVSLLIRRKGKMVGGKLVDSWDKLEKIQRRI